MAQAAVTRVLPQDHTEPVPYDASALNNLNMAGSSSSEHRPLPSPSSLVHRNIFDTGTFYKCSILRLCIYNLSKCAFFFLLLCLLEPESTTNSNSNDNSSQNSHALDNFVDVRDLTSSTTDNANRPDESSHSPKDLTFNIHHNFMSHVIVVPDTATIGLCSLYILFDLFLVFLRRIKYLTY